MGPVPLGRSCERGKVPSPWEPPSLAGRSAGIVRELQRLKRTVWEVASGQAVYKEASTDSPWHIATLPRPKHMPGCWNSGFIGQTWGEDSVWLHGDRLKGWECGLGWNWGYKRTQHGSVTEAQLSTREGRGMDLPQQSHCQHSHTRAWLWQKQVLGVHMWKWGWNMSRLPVLPWWVQGRGFSGFSHQQTLGVYTYLRTSEPITSTPTATVDFVGAHTRWQVISQSHTSLWTAPVEEYAAAPFSVGVLQSCLLQL